MFIKADELETCLLFILKPYIDEYGFEIISSQLLIEDMISLDTLMKYQNQSFRIQVHFYLKYENQYLVFDDIEGKVKYSFIELPFMQVFKQFMRIPLLEIKDNQCLYPIKLPIHKISIIQNQLMIEIKNKEFV